MKSKPYKAKSLSGAQAYVRSLMKQKDNMLRLLNKFDQDRKALAKLAAKGPMFHNPTEVWAAEKIRDEILATMNLKPDGTPLRG